jgi:NRPS condensation-like uncharacterized protein
MREKLKYSCTAFEELMLSQDSPRFPCVISVKMVFDRLLNRSLFEDAVCWMIETNPLFRAKLKRSWRGRSHWYIESGAVPAEPSVEWSTTSVMPHWSETRYIDLTRSTGLVVQAMEFNPHQASAGTVVFMHVHHAVADGLGIMHAIEDLWLRYDALCAREIPVKRSEREPDQLIRRNGFGLTLVKAIALIPKQCVGLAGVRQYVMRSPVPLVDAKPPAQCQLCEERISTLSQQFTVEQTSQWIQDARARKLTLNDLIAASIFKGCASLRSCQPSFQPLEWIRMMIPMSMRSARDHQEQTACNIVSCIFLDRTHSQIANDEMVLKCVHAELDLIKRNKLALIFIWSIWLKKVTTFAWANNARPLPARCQTSLVFTNLGKLFSSSIWNDKFIDTQRHIAVGGATLTHFEILAPLSPWMMVAFVASQYAGRLQLTLRYDSRLVSQSVAQTLLDDTVKYFLKLTSTDQQR